MYLDEVQNNNNNNKGHLGPPEVHDYVRCFSGLCDVRIFLCYFFFGDGRKVVLRFGIFFFPLIDAVLTIAGKVCADPYNHGIKH